MTTAELIEDAEEQVKSEVTSDSDDDNEAPELSALVQMYLHLVFLKNTSAKKSKVLTKYTKLSSRLKIVLQEKQPSFFAVSSKTCIHLGDRAKCTTRR